MVEKIYAPWDGAQVAHLYHWQNSPIVHPYTCPREHHVEQTNLWPTPHGWVCDDSACDYQQDWAWSFSLLKPWQCQCRYYNIGPVCTHCGATEGLPR